MKISYDPRLMEAVLLLEVDRRLQTGDRRLFDEYHRLADPLYDRFSPERRESAFAKLHERLFLKLGFGRPLLKALEEFPGTLEGVGEIFVGSARGPEDEGADLSRDLKALAIRLRPERFLEPGPLLLRLRHELMHVADILDGSFAYRGEERLSDLPAQENLLRDRYRLLWDISISRRLLEEGKETLFGRDDLRDEFDRLFGHLPGEGRALLFASLWDNGRATHGVLLRMAKDPAGFLPGRSGDPQVAPSEAGGASPSRGRRPLPGSPCPLCRFPTFVWAEEPARLDEAILEAIQGDFPTWQPEEGACQRCVEVYRLRGWGVGQAASPLGGAACLSPGGMAP